MSSEKDSFVINSIARDYVYKRFPRASGPEKEKIVIDWVNKMDASVALVDDFKRRVGEVRGKKILDVGSGNGGVSITFAKAGAIVTGIDVEEDLYEISKKHAQAHQIEVDFLLYDGDKLPFGDEEFDYIVSVSVLEHTNDPVFYLSEIFRVLKKGGVLYLGFPNKLWPKETHTQIWFLTYIPHSLRNKLVDLLNRNPLEDNNLHFYSYFELEKMLKVSAPEGSIHLIEEKGTSTSIVKKSMRWILKIIGISYKAFLPHILVLVKKND